MPRSLLNVDLELDLLLERIVPVPRHLVWKAWTQPEHLVKWFCRSEERRVGKEC